MFAVLWLVIHSFISYLSYPIMLFYSSIFITSLLGSLHCAGMCGGFVFCYSSMIEDYSKLPHVLYNLGRLLSYIILGFIAGLLAKSFNINAHLVGLQEISALLSGVLLLLIGLGMLKNSYFANFFVGISKNISNQIFSSRLTLNNKAFLLGISSSFLPCGWLYSYVILSASSSDIYRAILIMFFFWLGTVPILVATAFFVRLPINVLKKNIPLLLSIFIFLAGLYNIYLHFQHLSGNSQHCH